MTDERKNGADWLEARLTRALEAAPEVTVPTDFARRMMAGLPSRKVVRIPEGLPEAPSMGRRFTVAAAVVLLLTMFAVAPELKSVGAVPSALLEGTLAVEFVGLTLWLTLRRVGSA